MGVSHGFFQCFQRLAALRPQALRVSPPSRMRMPIRRTACDEFNAKTPRFQSGVRSQSARMALVGHSAKARIRRLGAVPRCARAKLPPAGPSSSYRAASACSEEPDFGSPPRRSAARASRGSPGLRIVRRKESAPRLLVGGPLERVLLQHRLCAGGCRARVDGVEQPLQVRIGRKRLGFALPHPRGPGEPAPKPTYRRWCRHRRR